MKVKFSAPVLPKAGVLVLLAASGCKLSEFGEKADSESGGAIMRALTAVDFDGKKASVADVPAPGALPLSRVLVFGVGEPEKLSSLDAEMLGGAIAGRLGACKAKDASVDAAVAGEIEIGEAGLAALIASGARLRNYRFDVYKTKKDKPAQELKAITVLTTQAAAARKAYAGFDAVAAGVHMARDLVNEPANVLFPQEFAKRAESLKKLGVEVDVLDERQMKKLKMGALLGVAQGSARPARMAVMKWNGGRKSDKPVAFVGKGVTFDTGGISIKPAGGMEDMKGDMGGAACVTGLMAALAGRKAKVNAVGVIGLVENMPDGKAQRPGDIVKSMSGQTIAVLNTDAEGRLVLADALWYVQQEFKPKFVVNLATLTGAIVVALGKEHAGLFSNNDELSERLSDSGKATAEKVWRMPLDAAYDKLIDSNIADMKNIGGRMAGSITAGQFLQRFIEDVPWAHLDIAGTAMDAPKSAINQSWGSGWGVRLLNHLVAKHYEG